MPVAAIDVDAAMDLFSRILQRGGRWRVWLYADGRPLFLPEADPLGRSIDRGQMATPVGTYDLACAVECVAADIAATRETRGSPCLAR